MKDEKHTIDNLFKDRLYDVESDVQPKSWNDISEKINIKASFPFKKWFYGIGLASTLVTVVAYLVYMDNTFVSTVSKESPIAVSKIIPITSDSVANVQNQVSIIHNKALSNNASIQQQISTLDERKTLQLPDGSEVILNRNSSVSYSTQFLTDMTVYVSGEVFVKVAASKGKKLIFIGNLFQIEASESSFIIKSDKLVDYDEIYVSTGKVECKFLVANANRIVIFAGNNAIINKGGDLEQSIIQNINYNDWVTQKIIFNNTALDSVFQTLEHYYNVSLKADNAEIMNCHFTGTFERNNIDEILQVLSVSFNLSFNQNSKEYILSGKGCK